MEFCVYGGICMVSRNQIGKRTKRSIIFILLFALLTKEMVFAYLHSDLDPTKWYYNEVLPWVKAGILKGYQESEILKYDPNGAITRSEMCLYINRVLGFSTFDGNFRDVKKTDWIYKEAAIAKKHYMPFYENLDFKGSEQIQRQEAIAMLSCALGLIPQDIVVYTDSFKDGNKVKESLKPYMEAAIRQKLIYGYPFNGYYYLRPEATITRAEVMALFSRSFDRLYNESGRYEYAKTLTISEDVAIVKGNTTLKNVRIKGNLYLLPSIKNQGVILENVEVDGGIYVRGGKNGLVKFRNVQAKQIVGSNYNGGVDLIGKSRVEEVYLMNTFGYRQLSLADSGAKRIYVNTGRPVTLEGEMKDVTVLTKGKVTIKGYDILEKLTIKKSADGTQLVIGNQGEVGTLFLYGNTQVDAQGVVKLTYSQSDSVISGNFYGVKQETIGKLTLENAKLRILEIGEKAFGTQVLGIGQNTVISLLAKAQSDVQGEISIRYKRAFASQVRIDGEEQATQEQKEAEALPQNQLVLSLASKKTVLTDGVLDTIIAKGKEDNNLLKTINFQVIKTQGLNNYSLEAETGRIIANGKGIITVKAVSQEDSTILGEASFSVVSKVVQKGTYIRSKEGTDFFASGETLDLSVYDEQGETRAIWSILRKDTGVVSASIDIEGKLKAQGQGQIVVEAVTVSGENVQYTATVGIYQKSDSNYSVVSQFGKDYVKSGQPTQLYLKKEEGMINATWMLEGQSGNLTPMLTTSGLLSVVGQGEITVSAKTSEGITHKQVLSILP